MTNRTSITLLSTLALLGLLSAAPRAEAATSIKIATLAPRESPWGQVFRVWKTAVKERTADAVELQFFWNGSQGDEGTLVGKMKTGQIDGAALTAIGLGVVSKDVLVLQLPGLYTGWTKFDPAREAVRGRLENAFKAVGFTILGWGDVGLDHFLSHGYGVKSPGDIKGKRPWVWREDPIFPVVYQAIGGVTPVLTGVPEVLPELTTGNVNLANVSPLAAEQLQWTGYLDHITAEVIAPSIGAIVFSTARWGSVPADQQAILLETGKVATQALTARIRAEDDAALGRLKQKMTVDQGSEADHAAWAQIYKEARARLSQGTFSADLVQQMEALAK